MPTPVPSTIAEIIELDELDTNNYGKYLTIEGTIIVENDVVYLEDSNGNRIVMKYSQYINKYHGETVTINIIIDSFHTTNLIWRASFCGRPEDIYFLNRTDEEIINEAIELVEIYFLDLIVDSDLFLGNYITNGVYILWESSHPDIITPRGIVTLPETETDVTLTATYSYHDTKIVQVYKVHVLNRIRPEISVYEALQLPDGEEVLVGGVVVAISGNKYIIYSNDAYCLALNIYNEKIEIGKYISISGYIKTINGLKQIEPVLAHYYKDVDIQLPIIMPGTLTELINRTKTAALIKAILSFEGEEVYLTDETNQKVLVNFAFANIDIEELRIYQDKLVEIPVFMSEAGNVIFIGGIEDIYEYLNDKDRVSQAAENCVLPDVVKGDFIDLPSYYKGVNITWTSSNDKIIDINGIIFKPEEDTEVILTAVFSYGEEVLSRDYTIMVTSSYYSAKDVLNSVEGDVLILQGIVVANSGYGYIIYSEGEYAFVYTGSVGVMTIGDELILIGEVGMFKGLKQIINPKEINTVSHDNELPTYQDGFLKDLIEGKTTSAVIVGTITIEGQYDNVYIMDHCGNKVQVYYYSTPEYNETNGAILKKYKDNMIILPVIMYQEGMVLFIGNEDDIDYFTFSDIAGVLQ